MYVPPCLSMSVGIPSTPGDFPGEVSLIAVVTSSRGGLVSQVFASEESHLGLPGRLKMADSGGY